MDNTVMERKDHSLVMKILFKTTELVIAKGTDGKVDYEKSELRMIINAFAATTIGEAAAGKIRLFVTRQRTPRCKSSLASWGSFFVRTPAGLAAALPRTFHNDVISGLSDHISAVIAQRCHNAVIAAPSVNCPGKVNSPRPHLSLPFVFAQVLPMTK